jgi:hypothetical protein
MFIDPSSWDIPAIISSIPPMPPPPIPAILAIPPYF